MTHTMDAPAVRTEPEITGAVDLCDGSGNLNRKAVGFSRIPLHRCNVRGHALRKKRWNYWAVTSDRYVFSATIADIDYIGLASVYLIDFETNRMIERTVSVPFGGAAMPETVYEDIRFRHKRLNLAIEDDGASVRIRAKANRSQCWITGAAFGRSVPSGTGERVPACRTDDSSDSTWEAGGRMAPV